MFKRLLFLIPWLMHFLVSSAQTGHLVISQIYGEGGNAGALFKNDFIELFNPGASAVSLNGWSVQYASANGSNWSANQVDLSGSIAPGSYFLIQLGSEGPNGRALPAPDLSSGNIIMSASAGKVALLHSLTPLTEACPDLSTVVDFLGYGNAGCGEGQPAVTPEAGYGLMRRNNGCTNADNNASDFEMLAPSPRNSSSPAHSCNGSYIEVVSVDPLPFCVDESHAATALVKYQATGTFSAATFSLRLSEASGSFTNALTVGSAVVSGTNPSGFLAINIPAGSLSGTLYRLRIDADAPSLTGLQSTPVEVINGAKNISALHASPNTGEMTLWWTNPSGCFDEILIAARQGAPVTGVPSGDGSGYTADSAWAGAGSDLGGGRVVFKGVAERVKLTGLTDGLTYYFKAFTRRGLYWSAGVEIADQPRLMPLPGEIVINQLSPGYNGATDEYIELVNTTAKTFDLSGLAVRYQAASGNQGVAGGSLSGSLPPYGFWLLSTNNSVTVGKTLNLLADGSFAPGFAASSGQVALIRKTDEAILDAVGYGSVLAGSFHEGAASEGPPAGGGLSRRLDGTDHQDNAADFKTVENAQIDLRNSGSRLAVAGAALPGGAYSRLYVSGDASLAGGVQLSEKVVLEKGKFSLGAFGLKTPLTEGGSDTSYIQTNGSGELTVVQVGEEARTIEIGNGSYNPLRISLGSGRDWSFRVEDSCRTAAGGKAVARTWLITPSGAVAGATLEFLYNDGDGSQLGAAFNKDEDVQIWNFHDNAWQSAGLPALPAGSAGSMRTVRLDNWSRFSPFAITNVSAVLPVRFSSLRLSRAEGGIRLDWANFTEENVDYYQPERSLNGKDFIPVCRIRPRFNNNSRADYSCLDTGLFSGWVYYRIKAVEREGTVSFSKTASLYVMADAEKFQIIPNPVFTGSFRLKSDRVPGGNYLLLLYNGKGQVVFRRSLYHGGGVLEQVFPIQLPAGSYWMNIEGPVNFTRQLLVVH